MSNYMKEMERLIDEVARLKWSEAIYDASGSYIQARNDSEAADEARAALLAHAEQADRAVRGVPVETTEVPVPEPDLLIRGFRDVAVHSKTLIRAYGDAREAAGYARGRAEPGGALESAQQRAEYWKSEYCAANAEIDKLCADLAASQAECERMRIPIGWKPAPFEPTAEMLDVAVSHALTVQISGEYNWSAYMRDVWMRMWSQIGAQSIPRAALAGEVKP